MLPLKRGVILLATFLSLFGCSAELNRFGVVLTAPERVELTAGTIVRASEVSDVNGLVTVVPLDGEREYGLKPGYVKRFDSMEEARAYAEEYRPYRTRSSRSLVQALRVRSQPNTASEDLYRLRKGERVKLVSRLSRRTNIDGLVGHWYEVVTPDGQLGFAFGPLLELGGESPVGSRSANAELDDRVDLFLDTVWRPAYMQEMLAKGRLDLTRFDAAIGLFPEPARDRVVLNTAKSRIVFEPLSEKPIGDNTVVFADGDLQVHFDEAPEDIVIRYEHAGVAVRERYVDLDVELEEVIEAERARREKTYQAILERGREYKSEHYGVLVLRAGQRVLWKEREAVVPRLIPQSAPQEAMVRFNRYLAPKLQSEYDGAWTFLFNMPSRDHSVVFLYELEQGGIRLSHVTSEYQSGTRIDRRPLSPLVMFFERVSDRPEQTEAR